MVHKKDKPTGTEIEAEELQYVDDIVIDDELEEDETSFERETMDYDFNVEKDYNTEEIIMPAKQLNDSISFDSIKLLFPLTEAEYVGFKVDRSYFFRSNNPEKPTTKNEDMLHLVAVEKRVSTMELSKKEEDYADKSMAYEYAKIKYPNAKPFFDYCGNLSMCNDIIIEYIL